MAESRPSKVEEIKRNSRYLRGTIAEELKEDSTKFSEENEQILKFHGIYQQDDRDLRQARKKEGLEPHYQMMVRARIPGGVVRPEAYLVFDELSDRYGNGSLRVTTRQTFQLHGVLKGNLKATIRRINDQLITTLGGCGDQVRNILLCPAPLHNPFRKELEAVLHQLVDALSAKTPAYHEIWLDGEKVAGGEPEEAAGEVEPLYGATYLPRKFKVAIAIEGDNCVDVYTNDLGFVAHRDGDRLDGFTVLVGGGMGRSAPRPDTYPRLADAIGFVTPDRVVELARTVVSIQRDYGNRSDRKQARMKYLIDKKGLDWFKEELERRLGWKLDPARRLEWGDTEDHLGWHEQGDGRLWLGLYLPNGRIKDTEDRQLKRALREIVERHRPLIRLTTQQNLLLSDIDPSARDDIEDTLRRYGVTPAEELDPVIRYSMACVALPTCGLAVAESERALPGVLKELQETLTELGLAGERISVRMTGCPNGCSRPYVGDIGFVGRSLGKYDIWLGGDYDGTRLSQLFEELVPYSELVSRLRPLLAAFKEERRPGETFGAYCTRIGIDELRRKGGQSQTLRQPS
ncbi:MAG: NADPH-dependent assimilatory sulfite reductase hemoprotein subunit [Alicyclobacillaceae bacterium]|nr:NADPH-dependent assimilatory sulfite reductase hemoprotein subunit [Alicyclobacillaceae bacterium]